MPSTATRFLSRPGEFFERRAARLSGLEGAVLAAVLSVLMTLSLAVSLRLFAGQFTGTRTVDNPAYPGETVCAGNGVTPGGCTEPPTVSREVSSLLWEQVVDILPGVFVGLLILWVFLSVALYVGARLAGGTAGLGRTAAVAAWGLVPTLVVVVLAGVVLVAFAAQADLSTSSPDALLTQSRQLQSGVSGLSLLLLQIGGAAWQAFVWAGGLRAVHEISRRAAVAVALFVAVIPVLIS